MAATRVRQTAGEDYLLHEGRRSDLQCRLLQRLNEARTLGHYGRRSGGDTMRVVVCLNAWIVLYALIVLNQLGRYAIRQVCWDMIKDAGF